MEQLKDPIYRFEAIAVTGDGERSPFSLSIFDGDEEGTNHYCWVRCPYIRDTDVKIMNVGKTESLNDALEFVRNFLTHSNTQIVNENGQEIDFSPLDT
ncbi:MAG TPA: hypothetical protein VIN57_04185 [Magnetovibrio sp.]